MVSYIEVDTAGNIVNTVQDPLATIVPLVNIIGYRDSNGAPLVDSQGRPIGPYGNSVLLPIGITETQFNQLVLGGIPNFTYSTPSGLVTKSE